MFLFGVSGFLDFWFCVSLDFACFILVVGGGGLC